MEFFEPYRDADKYAEAALRLMRAKQIIPNPKNFLIWYNYFAGNDPDLSKAVDQAVKGATGWPESARDEIFEQFYSTAPVQSRLDEAGKNLSAEVEKIMGFVSEAGRENTAYGDSLVSMSGQLEQEAEPSALQSMIGQIIAETRSMAEKTMALERRLSDSVSEISDLRSSLQEMKHEALTDGLTGIANRKAFDLQLREHVFQAEEEGQPLSLIIADVDHFKNFNDTYGHKIGDSVLKAVAKVLTEGTKGKDLPARYGGEEFCVILPQTELDNAVKVADALRETLAAKHLRDRKTGEDFGSITMSLGVGLYRAGESMSNLVQRADQALYAAKRSGRNRVCSELELPEEQQAATA